MAETHKFVCDKPAKLLYASIHEKSAPRGVAGAVAKFGGTFGLEEVDFKAIVDIMVGAIKTELGSFTSPADYYLACMGGVTAGKRVLAKAELDAQGKPSDEAFKIREKAEKRAELYKPFAGILIANSQYEVSMAYLAGGKVTDVADEPHAIAKAGKDYFYPGAMVVPSISLKAFRRKTVDAKDGVTAYLQNCLFVAKGVRLGGAGVPNNEVFGKYAGYSDYDPTAMAPAGAEDDVAF